MRGLWLVLALAAAGAPVPTAPTGAPRRRVGEVHAGTYQPTGTIRVICWRKGRLIDSGPVPADTVDWSRLAAADEIEECP